MRISLGHDVGVGVLEQCARQRQAMRVDIHAGQVEFRAVAGRNQNKSGTGEGRGQALQRPGDFKGTKRRQLPDGQGGGFEVYAEYSQVHDIN